MKSFFSMFTRSAKEFYDLRSLTVTAMFIAISMVIEKFTINFPLFKINFAFLAIAVIGMLCGPTVGFVAGMLCDIVGWIANPDGGFYPAYTLVAGVQGLIYGMLLYYKQDKLAIFGMNETVSLAIRTVIARLLDVVLINLLYNTFLNMHYGFIPQQAFGTAVSARLVKNTLELVADIPLLLLILPATLLSYRRIVSGREVRRPE